jgi:hypothetical protein
MNRNIQNMLESEDRLNKFRSSTLLEVLKSDEIIAKEIQLFEAVIR